MKFPFSQSIYACFFFFFWSQWKSLTVRCCRHWQLRSLISAEKPNVIYFPGGAGSNQVQRLNTTTLECETVKLLTFSPRCLVAGNGWVCCGGETGEFAAIQIDGGGESNDLDMSLDLDLDARLPLDLDSSRPTEESNIFSLIARARRSSRGLIAKSTRFARDRVNCITLWFPPSNGTSLSEGAYTEPVAVLANNDRTVTLVSLRDFESNEKAEPLEVISYPDYVNRAIISPDGRLLIAILDDPYLYIHQRTERGFDDQKPTRAKDKAEYMWQLSNTILLKSQRQQDRTDSRGSFAACFSNSGAYLAVGTQYGTISIFYAGALANSDMDPLLTTFTSTRPETGPGAIRDMAFCPGPYELLAWTEDRGHVGVADIRSHFFKRQILDISGDDLEHISILDRNTIAPRLLNPRSERSEEGSGWGFSSSLNLTDSRRRRGTDGLDRHHVPLTADETAVLEAMQDDRRRREQRVAMRSSEALSALQSASPWSERIPRRPGATDGDSSRATRERSSSVTRTIGDLLGNIRDQRERAQERVRSAQLLLRDAQDRERRQALGQGRRSTSVRPAETSSPPAPRASGTTRVAPTNLPSSTGWADLEALYNLSLDSSLYESRPSDGDASRRDRDRGAFIPLLNHLASAREWEENSAIRRRTTTEQGVHDTPAEPDNTAGISWSRDGRIL
jgi:hypothetical protein